jgi:16S rRNA (adenine1518-N6/adenine1519-N6)-dimethyltransferase
MINFLKNEINNKKFKLVEGDFLTQNLNFKNKKILIANIPYNITSNILFKLFENSKKFSHAIIMVQKEVAERLSSKVGSKNYGKLTISTKYFASIKYKFIVPSNAFLPIPKVESAIILLTFKDKKNKKSKEFLEFIKNCFAMRRKTLFNNLKKFLGVEKASEIIFKNNLTSKIRPQELTYKKYLDMFNNI